MRWIALFGTAVTLAVSLVVFVGYFDMPGVHDARRADQSLASRTRATAADAGGIRPIRRPGPTNGLRPAAANDWVVRVPWIPAFNIEYFLGVDGISCRSSC